MFFDAHMDDFDQALIHEAIERVTHLAAEQGIEITVGDVTAKLCELFVSGERDARRIAALAMEGATTTVH